MQFLVLSVNVIILHGYVLFYNGINNSEYLQNLESREGVSFELKNILKIISKSKELFPAVFFAFLSNFSTFQHIMYPAKVVFF